MDIKIAKAFENNLQDLSVTIPLNRMTAITGISGSGKTTLLRNVLAATGAQRYSFQFSRMVRSALAVSRFIRVKSVENLPLTLLVDAKSSVANPMSTVATVSGLQETLRSLFISLGEVVCPHCKTIIEKKEDVPQSLLIEIICDEKYDLALDFLRKVGTVHKELFFDSGKHLLRIRSKRARYAELHVFWKDATDRDVHQFNKKFEASTLVDTLHPYDPLLFSACDNCGTIVPRLRRSRMSFTTPFAQGGGMCRCCNGTGVTSNPADNSFIVDTKKSILNGGIRFVSDKGIQYTTITSSDLKTIARHFGINIKAPLSSLTCEAIDLILHGSETPIPINIGRGKKKEILFHGVIGSLQDSFAKGKSIPSLSPYFSKSVCPVCGGTRFDPAIDSFQLFGTQFSDFMRLTISELDNWVCRQIPSVSKSIGSSLNQIARKTATFRRVACGHLSLDRMSASLSGGELQRIRVCSLLNACVNGICYLLDEPSTGLHDQDIKSLGGLLKEICHNGNTVIMVEHNRKLVQYCDWIVDLGPRGGTDGGKLLFSDWIQNVAKYDTITSSVLMTKSCVRRGKPQEIVFSKWLQFDHLIHNNLKNLSIKLPYGAFTVVCGVSGSGKTTFLRDVLFSKIHDNPRQFGFGGVLFLSQRTSSFPYSSTVSTQLAVFPIIAKLYSKESHLPPSFFLPNSVSGKCKSCGGRRELLSDSGDVIGICPTCSGSGYEKKVLHAAVSGVLFEELLKAPLSSIGSMLKQQEFSRLSRFCDLLGIGHLTLSRRTNTLSRGEVQRLHIANSLAQETHNTLFLLDEPSKGLHLSDANKLVAAIRLLLNVGNTVVAVEHNTAVIENCDYIIELGGIGREGGHLLFNDYPRNFFAAKTPTANCLKEDTFLPAPMTETNATESAVVYSVDGNVHHFAMNEVHQSVNEAGEIKKLSSATNEDFLAAAMPANPVSTRVGDGNEEILSSPLVYSIDFSVTTKRSDTLYDLFGLRELVTSSISSQCPESLDLIKYVFDDESPTGKCPFCLGHGKAVIMPTSCFLDGSRLSKDCVSFLKNSSSFSEVGKWLQRAKGFHLSDSINDLDYSGQLILLYGTAVSTEVEILDVKWPGLVNFFLRNHSYYPETLGSVLYSKREQAICPICKGEMLKTEYSSCRLAGKYSFKDILTHSFGWLLRHLNESEAVGLQEIKSVMEMICESGLGECKPGDVLSNLDAQTSGLCSLLSIAIRGFVQSGIALFNLESLQSDRRKIAMKLVQRISRSNTVFIC